MVPPLCPLGVSPYDFNSVGSLIDRALRSTEDWLREGVEEVDGVPHQLEPHTHNESEAPYGPATLHRH